MDVLQIIVLAVVQGLTEFLPVSSSAHLILVPILTDWQDQGLSFDLAVHVGSLGAVVVYFKKELQLMIQDWLTSLFWGKKTANSRLAWAVIIGTLPAGIIGLLGKDLIETHLRSPLVIATTFIIFGVLLGYSYAVGRRNKSEYELLWVDVVIIGFAQAVALIPGTSRSGITITAALFRGLTGAAASRFSFLLSIPIITAGGLLLCKDVIEQPQQLQWSSLLLGAILSGLSAYLCIHYFLKLLDRIGMLPFVVYRIALGVVLLFIFW